MYEYSCTYANKNANVALLVVVVVAVVVVAVIVVAVVVAVIVVLGMPIKAPSIAAMPAPRTRASSDRIKQTGE